MTDDLISRQAVLDELNKWDWQELYLPIHFKENIIDVVPSVTPQEPKAGRGLHLSQRFKDWQFIQESKMGHWNEVFNDIEGEVRFYCSECNDYQMFTSRYCPNCGARMTENDRTCHTCKHYTSGENDGSCDSYICKGYSDWESDNCN